MQDRARKVVALWYVAAILAVALYLGLRGDRAASPAAADSGAPGASGASAASAPSAAPTDDASAAGAGVEPEAADAGVAERVDASADDADDALTDWKPAGMTCRRPVPRDTTFRTLSDAQIAATLIQGFDPRKRRFPLTPSPRDDAGEPLVPGGEWAARDCRGDRVLFDTPLSAREAISTEGRGPTDAQMAREAEDVDVADMARVHVERYGVLGAHLPVYATVSLQNGLVYTCLGFAAILRLEPDALVVEAARSIPLAGCAPGSDLKLARVGKQVLLLVAAADGGYGENHDATGEWDAYLAEGSRLVRAGSIPSSRSRGNESIMSGEWVPTMSAKVVGMDGALRVEETWVDERGGANGPPLQRGMRKVASTYVLRDRRLVRLGDSGAP
jgi:hypothetical protein